MNLGRHNVLGNCVPARQDREDYNFVRLAGRLNILKTLVSDLGPIQIEEK